MSVAWQAVWDRRGTGPLRCISVMVRPCVRACVRASRPLPPHSPRTPSTQVASLRDGAAAVEALRADAASLQEALSEGERLAALNSEMRLVSVGMEALRHEQARLAPVAAQAQVGCSCCDS